MRRLWIVGLVAATFLVATAIVGEAASDGRRQPAARDVPTMERAPSPEAMARFQRMVDQLGERADSRLDALASSVNCRDVACLNRELTKLSNFANATAKRLKKLDRFSRDQLDQWETWYDEWNNCVPIAPITQYGDPAGSAGYLYTNDRVTTFPTTGLDVTYEGDPVTFYALMWTCEVA